MTGNGPPDVALPTASGSAPELLNAVESDVQSGSGETPTEAEYRSNVRPPDWVNPKPKQRYNLVVLGGGPAGIAAARLAAEMGAAVALIERDALGGDNLNYGSVPSKTLIATARQVFQIRQAAAFGVEEQPEAGACFVQMTRRVKTQAHRFDTAAAKWIEQPVVWKFSDAMITHPGIPI